ncbi:MAG: lipopolysaccharide export system permease protein [Arenicella sp.]|jgi:lipopolysaccharide export system permease protein
MFTKIDRYIMKKFLGTFIFIMILLMSISAVFDLSAKINDFLAAGAPWDQIILVYYSNFFIFYGFQFIYLINFISVIWFTSKMATNTEIVPILSAGVSFNRMLRPYFISATILVGATILMTNYVLPESNKARLEFEATFYKSYKSSSNIRARISEDEILYFRNYNAMTGEILTFSFEKWDGDSLEYILESTRAIGDSVTNDWHFDRYELRRFGDFNDELTFGFNTDTVLSFSVGDVIFRSNVIESMNNEELDAFIEKERLKGSDKVPVYLIEKYKRWASPFAIFILTLIGVSVSSKKARGGLGMNIALGLLIATLYIFSMQVTSVAAIKVGFTPILAVWLPNIIFSIIAIVLYIRAPK